MAPYLVLLGASALVRAVLMVAPVDYINRGQHVLWSWPIFGVVVLGTLVGAWCARRAGLPGPLDGRISGWQRFALPAAVGTAIAAAIVLSDILSPIVNVRGLTRLHVPPPVSVPFYRYGAVVLTILFHFLPLAVIAALCSGGRRWRRTPVWLGAVLLLGLSEDAGYFLREGLPLTMETGRHIVSYGANVAELMFIRSSGLFAGLSQRCATYAWWHVAWGGWGST